MFHRHIEATALAFAFLRPTKVRQVKSCLELKLVRSKALFLWLSDVRELLAMLLFYINIFLGFGFSLKEIEGKCLSGFLIFSVARWSFKDVAP